MLSNRGFDHSLLSILRYRKEMYSILSSLLEMTRKKDQIFFSFEHFEKKRTILGVLKKTFYSFFSAS